MLPQKDTTVEEAIADYHETLLPTATSYGKTILADGKYVGGIMVLYHYFDKKIGPFRNLSDLSEEEANQMRKY